MVEITRTIETRFGRFLALLPPVFSASHLCLCTPRWTSVATLALLASSLARSRYPALHRAYSTTFQHGAQPDALQRSVKCGTLPCSDIVFNETVHVAGDVKKQASPLHAAYLEPTSGDALGGELRRTIDLGERDILLTGNLRAVVVLWRRDRPAI
jgi:hypothetical protein